MTSLLAMTLRIPRWGGTTSPVCGRSMAPNWLGRARVRGRVRLGGSGFGRVAVRVRIRVSR